MASTLSCYQCSTCTPVVKGTTTKQAPNTFDMYRRHFLGQFESVYDVVSDAGVGIDCRLKVFEMAVPELLGSVPYSKVSVVEYVS